MYDIYISEWISYSNLSWLDQSLNFTSIIWSISIPMTSCKWASHPTKLFHYSIISSFFPKKIELFCINPLLPSYTIRRHRTWSRLTRVIVCCLKAPSHKRNQCWQFCGIPCSSIFLRMHEMSLMKINCSTMVYFEQFYINLNNNKENLRDLIAVTGLVILLKLDSNLWIFSPCDLEIWWMTLKNNRTPLLCCFKLCASFHSHQWIQT